MTRLVTILIFLLNGYGLSVQHIDVHVREGNAFYKQGKYDKALSAYEQSVAKKNDPITRYNFGNALFRNSKFDESVKMYDQLLATNMNNNLKQKAFYNKGVSLLKQKKLDKGYLLFTHLLQISFITL